MSPGTRTARSGAPALLSTTAAISCAAGCALGAAVATGRLDTSGSRWAHHALYALTTVLTLATVSTVAWSPSPAGWTALPALVPLAVVPWVSARSDGHVVLASAVAAPLALAAGRSLARR
jgi:hypothetical protein